MADEMSREDFIVPKKRVRENRNGFFRKLFGILTAKLCLSTLITGIIVAEESIQEWLIINWPFFIACGLIYFLVHMVFLCFIKATKEYPKNLILLSIYAISEALLVGNLAAFVDPMTVLIAVVLTLGVTIGVTVYAVLTKNEFGPARGVMSGLILGLMLFAIFYVVFHQTRFIGLMICLAFIVVYSYLIVTDSLRIVSYWWRLSYDDYIIGPLCFFIDFLTLLLYLLASFCVNAIQSLR